jgi:hypothetical protein
MTKVIKNSKSSERQNCMAVSKHWCKLELDTSKHKDLNLMFANHIEEDEINPLTTIEIAEAQKKDQDFNIYHKQTAKTPSKDCIVFNLSKTQQCYVKMKN